MNKKDLLKAHKANLKTMLADFSRKCQRQLERSFSTSAFDENDDIISPDSCVLANVIISAEAAKIRFASKEARSLKENLSRVI